MNGDIEGSGNRTRSVSTEPASEPPKPTHPLAERFAEVRGEHGWARYVDDETLAAWLLRLPT